MPASPAASWSVVIKALVEGHDLSPQDARWAIDAILSGDATDAQIAGFAIALRAKGETPGEVQVLVDSMLLRSERVLVDRVVLDVVGTGGDHSGSVNISTMAALVCAASGAPVVKHGNRAASSRTGTADVLEELGVAISLSAPQVSRCLDEVGIGFAFAPVHHPAMRHAAGARRELGVPTVFNILGPLTNPALAGAALIGCADIARAPVMAEVLARRGVRALVVRGEDGLDEISTAAPTMIWDATGSAVDAAANEPVVITPVVIEPEALGLRSASAELLAGDDPVRNAALLRMTLGTGAVPDPERPRVLAIRDAVAVNAAAAMVAWRSSQGSGTGPLAGRISAEMPGVRRVIESGDAGALLERWIAVSRRLAAG